MPAQKDRGNRETARTAVAVESVSLGGNETPPALMPAGMLRVAAPTQEEPGPIRDINRPGECVDVPSQLVPDKTNIICFWATWCPWSQKAQPKLLKLCTKRPEFVCLRVDIDQFRSPVAQQYGITAVPSYMIYGPDGKLVASGEDARARVKELFEQTQD
ncbi:MAG: thioredoxin family protein [Candidatus Eremiobacterota bacterium]